MRHGLLEGSRQPKRDSDHAACEGNSLGVVIALRQRERLPGNLKPWHAIAADYGHRIGAIEHCHPLFGGDRLVEECASAVVDFQSLVRRMSLQSPHRRAERHLQRQLATVALRTFRQGNERRIARSRWAAASALAERSRARSPPLCQ